MNTNNTYISIFRVVSQAEFDEIVKTQEFRTTLKSFDSKQFCFSYEDAERAVPMIMSWDKCDLLIIKISIPDQLIYDKEFEQSIDIDPSIFKDGVLTVQDDKLSLLNENYIDLELVTVVKFSNES